MEELEINSARVLFHHESIFCEIDFGLKESIFKWIPFYEKSPNLCVLEYVNSAHTFQAKKNFERNQRFMAI